MLSGLGARMCKLNDPALKEVDAAEVLGGVCQAVGRTERLPPVPQHFDAVVHDHDDFCLESTDERGQKILNPPARAVPEVFIEDDEEYAAYSVYKNDGLFARNSGQHSDIIDSFKEAIKTPFNLYLASESGPTDSFYTTF